MIKLNTVLKNALKVLKKLAYSLDWLIYKLAKNNLNNGGKSMLNLEKGQTLDLIKEVPTLENIRMCAGWDVLQGTSLDADLSVFLVSAGGSKDAVYFGNLEAPGVTHTGDNLTGEGEGDDEIIKVNLSMVSPEVVKLVFVLNIFKAKEKGQNLSHFENGFIRAVDDSTGKEIARYEFKSLDGASDALLFAELSKAGEFTILSKEVTGDLNQLAAII